MLRILLIIVLCSPCLGRAQNTIGLPDIKNYNKQSYRAGAQSRQIRQDKRGILYFANNEGVLTFNGINWKTYPLPNRSIVRSLEFGPDNRLYAGGQDEFGYFSPGTNGELIFHSLKSLVPANERSCTDVWEIHFYRDGIFFQTSEKIIQISGGHCTVYKSFHWRFMSEANGMLIAQDDERGLLSFTNGIWAPFPGSDAMPREAFLVSSKQIGTDSALLATVKHGLYLMTGSTITPFRSPTIDSIAVSHISAAIPVNKDNYALITNLDGCYIIDRQGALVQHFGSKEGLQNNNVLGIFLDREKNLWLGLDNGIDFIAYNNAIKHLYADYQNEGSGYAASIYNNELYLGTSNGLYHVPLYNTEDLSYIRGTFRLVNNTKGQVWNLSQVNGKLLMGHHEGAFQVENGNASSIDNMPGYWNFAPYSNIMPSSLMLAGTYQGINFFRYENGTFRKLPVAASFESSRFVCVDNNTIWVSHPYRGIFRVTYDSIGAKSVLYGPDKGVVSNNGNYIFKIRNRIILATEQGIREYNPTKDKFEPSVLFNGIFGDKKIRYLKEDDAGNVWFVFDKIIGLVDMQGKPEIIYFPELTNKFVSGFEHVYTFDQHNVFIGGEKGFYHVNLEEYKKIKYPLTVLITSVEARNNQDSLLFGGYLGEMNSSEGVSPGRKSAISHSWNSFHFEFAAPVYGQQANIEYAYILENFDDSWSAFSQKTEKEYTNLPAGNYIFKVKARNNLGNESALAVYSFTVLPPWYQTKIAYGIYILLFIIANYLLYRFLKQKFRGQQQRYEEEQKRMQYLHQLELEKTDKELVKLRNEKLEAEIQHKNTELASVAMHLVQKGELIGKIKDQVVKLKKQSSHEKDEDLRKIIRSISEEDQIDKQWEQFTMHFDNVHSAFLAELKNRYPNLSGNELKLCAYLRMNLSTKEIAQLMNISPRGVEISRYRLRKKLQIATEVNLFEFLLGIYGSDGKKN